MGIVKSKIIYWYHVNKSKVILSLFCMFYGFLTFFFQVIQYSRFDIPYGDVGIIAGMTWVAQNFGTFFYNNNMPFYALDGAFILSLISPFEHLFGIYSLFFTESLCLSLTAYYIFLYAHRRIGIALSVILTLLFLVSPSVLVQPDWGFDPLIIVMCGFTIFVYYSLELSWHKSKSVSKRLFLYLLLIISLLSKNEASLVGIGLGLLMIFRKDTRKLGISVVSISLGWMVLLEGIIIPHLYNGADPNTQHNWGYMGKTTIDKVMFLLKNPSIIVQSFLQHSKYIVITLGLFFPFLFLSPYWALPISPVIFGNILSHFSQSTNIFDEYTFFIIPFLIFSVADALAFILKRGISRNAKVLIFGYLGIGIVFSASYSISHLVSGNGTVGLNNGVSKTQSIILNAAFKDIDNNSLLETPDQIGSHAYNHNYYDVSANGINGLESSINLYLKKTHSHSGTLNYIFTNNYEGNSPVSGWIVFDPKVKDIIAKDGVYLLQVPISNSTSINDNWQVKQFEMLTKSAKLYLKNHSLNSLYPLTLEQSGYLPKSLIGYPRNQPNWNWTGFQGWLGAWKGGYAVGEVIPSAQAHILMKEYINRASKIYYPYPPTSSGENDIKQGFLLMVFPSN